MNQKGQNLLTTQERKYQELIDAYLEIIDEMAELKKQGMFLKHKMLQKLDETKRKKVMKFIDKI